MPSWSEIIKKTQLPSRALRAEKRNMLYVRLQSTLHIIPGRSLIFEVADQVKAM